MGHVTRDNLNVSGIVLNIGKECLWRIVSLIIKVDWFEWMMVNEFFEGLIIGKGSGSLLQGNVEVLENLSCKKEWRFW